MSHSNSAHASGGVGFFGLLTIAFVVLKLCGVIGWSGWWGLSPIWIPLLVLVAIFVLVIIGVLTSKGDLQ